MVVENPHQTSGFSNIQYFKGLRGIFWPLMDFSGSSPLPPLSPPIRSISPPLLNTTKPLKWLNISGAFSFSGCDERPFSTPADPGPSRSVRRCATWSALSVLSILEPLVACAVWLSTSSTTSAITSDNHSSVQPLSMLMRASGMRAGSTLSIPSISSRLNGSACSRAASVPT